MIEKGPDADLVNDLRRSCVALHTELSYRAHRHATGSLLLSEASHRLEREQRHD